MVNRDEARATWSGWRSREIEIAEHAPDRPVPVEITGGWTSNFQIFPLRKTSREIVTGGELGWTRGVRPARAVVPAGFNALRVVRRCPGRSVGGVARWRLSVLSGEELPLLAGEVSGSGAAVFRYEGGPAGVSFDFHSEITANALVFNRATGGEVIRLSRHSEFKGVGRLPGAGFLSVPDCRRWAVKVF
ncbi:hypothetical protein [Streptomyces sp. NPDC026673]|uniref:hypothetical protein n=1 Tax=Streptomyces sp. NPDC026673 TaxID=3155724 RepID=UPI00340AB188